MTNPFFPTFAFAMGFTTVLLGGLSIASWKDLRTLIVPKKITISLLSLGILANIIRGVWLGIAGHSVWAFDSTNPFLTGLDGLLFALSGFLMGFAVFFLLWVFGVCGGGDVKLAAAVGGWVGPLYLLGVLALALPVVFLLTIVRLGLAILAGKPKSAGSSAPVQWRLMSYSLPITIAVAALMAIGFLSFKVQFVNPVQANG